MGRASAPSASVLRVAVACSPAAGQAVETSLNVAAGATVLDAIRASAMLERFPGVDLSSRCVGIWGRPCDLATTLADGDRVEIYRPLTIDPKEARRKRAGTTTRRKARSFTCNRRR